jgi:hypothetical protein
MIELQLVGFVVFPFRFYLIQRFLIQQDRTKLLFHDLLFFYFGRQLF